MSDAHRLEELLGEAYEMDHGEAQVRILDEAVKLADSLQDMDMAFYARMQLTEAATFSGHNERMMTSFSWCLAQYEKDADRYEELDWDLMWQFKWVVSGISSFPHVPTPEFHRLLAQMKTMYQERGYGLRSVHYTHFTFCFDSGNFAEAKRLLEIWPDLPRDDLADCEACEADSYVNYYSGIDEPEKAIQAATSIVNGEQTCAEVPHVTYSTLLRCLAQVGRYDEADEYQAKDYRMIRRNSEFLLQIGEHISYLVHRNKLTKAIRLVETHLDWALHTYELNAKFHFLAAATHLLEQLGDKPLKLKLPTKFARFESAGVYDVSELAEWFRSERDTLAQSFDNRNGNDHFGRRLVEVHGYVGI
jgi:tetratricopeptide (TPR) repeat protein